MFRGKGGKLPVWTCKGHNDGVDRQVIWMVCGMYGEDGKLLKAQGILYAGAEAQVHTEGEMSELT